MMKAMKMLDNRGELYEGVSDWLPTGFRLAQSLGGWWAIGKKFSVRQTAVGPRQEARAEALRTLAQ